MSKMIDAKTVCYTRDRAISYPEVTPGFNRWIFSDDDPTKPMEVTSHGLRRLLRFVANSESAIMYLRLYETSPEMATNLYGNWSEKIGDLINELSAIRCEQNFVMSRLLIDTDGSIIVHKDEEIDMCGIPMSEKTGETK